MALKAVASAPTSSSARGETRTSRLPAATSSAASVSSSSGPVIRRLTNRLMRKASTAATSAAITRLRVSALWYADSAAARTLRGA